MKFLRSYGLYLAWVVCLIGTMLSLYYSEIRHIEPCRYCWYQRAALFPLAIQLGIFTYRNDTNAAFYAIPICLFGFGAALIQSVDLVLDIHGLCGSSVPCNKEMIYFLNIIPFSWLSGAGFLVIASLLWMARPPRHEHFS